MSDAQRDFRPFYPDVLGAITGGTRITMEKIQFALGIFPQQVYINQPFEAVLVLQSMIDVEMNIKIGIQLPSSDKRGNLVVLETPTPQINIKLSGGEVGILRAPIVGRPPTQPGKDFPLRVALRYRAPENVNFVRPPTGGAPPSVLTISPFKLQVLRDVAFEGHTWNNSSELITTYFELAPKRIPQPPALPKARYEALWTRDQMADEIRLAKERIEDARQLAQSSLYSGTYESFKAVVEDRFAARGMPLHPGEVMAIAKMMAYVIDEAPVLEQIEPENTRWFMSLCQVLAHDPDLMEDMDRNDIIAQYVFDDVMYEAVFMGFRILETKVNENLGSKRERIEYANRILGWWAGRGEPDLSYIYLPLVLGGLAVHRLVRHASRENPWEMLDALEEAMRGRMRLADTDSVVVFNMLEDLLEQAARGLRAQRIDRP